MTDVQIKLTEFSDLITRYTSDFVGRECLVKQVNELLDEPGCRFIVLTGGPGVGKTAFLAHLAATHPGWPHYFIRRDSRDLPRPGDANTFLLTIGGQLATLYPRLFHPENLEVVVRQRIGDVEAGGEAIGARIEELHTSPFYRVALLVEQKIRRVEGKATALEIGRLVSEARLWTRWTGRPAWIGSPNIYFREGDMDPDCLSRLAENVRVEVEVEQGPKGPRARSVKVIA